MVHYSGPCSYLDFVLSAGFSWQKETGCQIMREQGDCGHCANINSENKYFSVKDKQLLCSMCSISIDLDELIKLSSLIHN